MAIFGKSLAKHSFPYRPFEQYTIQMTGLSNIEAGSTADLAYSVVMENGEL